MFHRRGPAAARLLSPKLVRVRGTTSVLWEDEQRWTRPCWEMSRMSADRYVGASTCCSTPVTHAAATVVYYCIDGYNLMRPVALSNLRNSSRLAWDNGILYYCQVSLPNRCSALQLAHVCACVTCLQHSAQYRFGRFAYCHIWASTAALANETGCKKTNSNDATFIFIIIARI